MSEIPKAIEPKEIGETHLPVQETSGTLATIYVNLSPPSAPRFESEVEVVRKVCAEIPTVQVVLGIREDDSREQVKRKLETLGVVNHRLMVLPKIEGRPWAREIGFWADGGRSFVIPAEPPPKRSGLWLSNTYVPEPAGMRALREKLGVEEVVVSPFSFDGGDALFANGKVYLGYECVNSKRRLEQAKKAFEGQQVIVLGDGKVSSPFPHLDSAVALASDNVALVNNPRWLFEILSSLTHEELRTWQRRFRERFAGRGKTDSHSPVKSDTQISEEVIRDISLINEVGMFGYDMGRQGLQREVPMMGRIKTQLKESGMRTIDLPGMTFMGLPFSPVNCLVDTYQEETEPKRRVFVPTFGLERLDQEVANALERSGLFAEIIPVEVGWELALARGGLRCAVNGLRKVPET